MKIFVFNNQTGDVELNIPELLLIPEFAKLIEPKRNVCKDDIEGRFKLRAFRELKYIYLMIDLQSPYKDWPEQVRHATALSDANITPEEWEDSDFRAACRKYRKIVTSYRSYKYLESAYKTIDKLTDYFTNLLDFTQKTDNGSLLFKPKDVMVELQNLGKVLDSLKDAEKRYNNDVIENNVRGEAEPGRNDL